MLIPNLGLSEKQPQQFSKNFSVQVVVGDKLNLFRLFFAKPLIQFNIVELKFFL